MKLSKVYDFSNVRRIVEKLRENVEKIVNEKVAKCIEEVTNKELEKDASYDRMKKESDKSVNILKRLTDK